MNLAISVIFAFSAITSGFNTVLLKDRAAGTIAPKAEAPGKMTASKMTVGKITSNRALPKELARIDETPDRHDASGGSASTHVSPPSAIT